MKYRCSIPIWTRKQSRKSTLVSVIAQWEEEIGQIKAGIHSLEIDINGRKKDHERFEDEVNTTKQRIAALEFNRQNIKSEETEAWKRWN